MMRSRFAFIRVPERCLSCGAKWAGGHEVPGSEMKPGLRVFYACGASFSIKEELGEDGFLLLLKNCSHWFEDYWRDI